VWVVDPSQSSCLTDYEKVLEIEYENTHQLKEKRVRVVVMIQSGVSTAAELMEKCSS
jgi:hypothetical protein